MAIKKTINWEYSFKGIKHNKKEITFNKAMLIFIIGPFWYEFFYDEKGKLRYSLDDIIATAREVGKTYVITVIIIYELINNPLVNFVLTRKYGTAAGSWYEMFNQVLNDLEDKFELQFKIKWTEEEKYKNKKGKEITTYKVVKEVNKIKGKGSNTLFCYGKTGDDKLAIFYNANYDVTKNQICFLRGADDADGSRGLSVNVGYIAANILEEYSQEVDKGKLNPGEQITRYTSLWKSANRYSIKMVEQEKFPDDFRTKNIAMANIWDPDHEYNRQLLKVITEKEFRKFVSKDLDKNTHIIKEVDGIKYFRATCLFNTFLYPYGSEIRKAKVKELENILKSKDDYAKAQDLGFTFPGFLKSDNPIRHIIKMIQDAPEMTVKQLKQKYKIDSAEYGTDPGLRDAWVSIPSYLVIPKKEGRNKIYINDFFEINNKERIKNKMEPIPAPFIKQEQMEWWKKDLKNSPPELQNYLEVNMDMRSTAIRDDFNYEIFPRENINGQCVSIPSQESQGFGLEQRPDELVRIIPDMIFDPQAKHRIILALKTLELYSDDKKQPHPRKGMIDTYDALCYAVVKHRMHVGGANDR